MTQPDMLAAMAGTAGHNAERAAMGPYSAAQDWRVTRMIVPLLLAGAAMIAVTLTADRGLQYALLSLDSAPATAALLDSESTPTGWDVTVEFVAGDDGLRRETVAVSNRPGYNPFSGDRMPETAEIVYFPSYPAVFQFPETLAYQRGDYIVFLVSGLALLIVVLFSIGLAWRQAGKGLRN